MPLAEQDCQHTWYYHTGVDGGLFGEGRTCSKCKTTEPLKGKPEDFFPEKHSTHKQ